MPRSLDWIKVATGSLGQGLGVGAGMALAYSLRGGNLVPESMTRYNGEPTHRCRRQSARLTRGRAVASSSRPPPVLFSGCRSQLEGIRADLAKLKWDISAIRSSAARKKPGDKDTLDAALLLWLSQDQMQKRMRQAERAADPNATYFWLRFGESVDTTPVREAARKAAVGFQAGSVFSSKGQLNNYLRLSFAHYSEDDIREGIARLRPLF